MGQVGAGKSSLLSAMLGEMERVEGKVSVRVREGKGEEEGHWEEVCAKGDT